MIKLYFHRTPNPLKVAIALEEMGLPYELMPIDMFAGEQHQPAYRALNPNGKVPAVEDDDGTIVFDSNAILLYLTEKTGRLGGADGDRPNLLSWLLFTATGLGPFSGQAVHFTLIHTDSAYATHRYLREVERHLTVLDMRLARSTHIAGAAYSIADIAAWPWIDWANRNQLVLVDQNAWSKWPNLERWFRLVGERPAVERATKAGKDLAFKTEFDEETARALFPQNFASSL